MATPSNGDTQKFQQNVALASRSNPHSAGYSRRTQHHWFSLGPFNFRKRTVKNIKWKLHKNEHTRNRATGSVIGEETVYAWVSRLVGYGIEWTVFGPAGAVSPSLSIYPVLPYSWLKKMGVFVDGTVENLAAAFDSGEFHPFMQDNFGWTMLHVRHLGVDVI